MKEGVEEEEKKKSQEINGEAVVFDRTGLMHCQLNAASPASRGRGDWLRMAEESSRAATAWTGCLGGELGGRGGPIAAFDARRIWSSGVRAQQPGQAGNASRDFDIEFNPTALDGIDGSCRPLGWGAREVTQHLSMFLLSSKHSRCPGSASRADGLDPPRWPGSQTLKCEMNIHDAWWVGCVSAPEMEASPKKSTTSSSRQQWNPDSCWTTQVQSGFCA